MIKGITARWTLALLMLSAFALAGCSNGSNGEPAEGQQSSQAQDRMEMAKAEEAPPATLSLTPKNETGIGGSLEITYGMDSTRVDLTLTGLEPEAMYTAHIHEGSCDNPGTVVLPLESVIADSDGTGHSTSTVGTAELERAERSGQVLIQAHLPDGTPAACVNLPTRYSEAE